jgi:hypothetical protein
MAERYQVITFVTAEQTLDELYSKASNKKGMERCSWGLELFNLWKHEIMPELESENFRRHCDKSANLVRLWSIQFPT